MIRILIVRLSSIGDIFHTMTILPDIKTKFPESKIDWLVDKSFENIALLSPLIDNVISIPLRSWKKNKLTWIIKLFKYKAKLNKYSYNYIIDTQGLIKSAIITKYLFTGKIYGLDRKSAREPLASYFYNYKFYVNQDNIAVKRFKELIAKIFELDLSTDLSKIKLPILFKESNINKEDLIILLLHGTSRQDKKWEIDNWIELTKWILSNRKGNIYLTYSNNDELKFTQQFKAKFITNRVQVIDKLEFNQVADLINKSALVIGVDTGFTHLSNLLGKPTLAIYLNSNPDYVGIIESEKSHNFGGLNSKVNPLAIITYIKNNNLL